ncbi:retrovirus-related pol polyprotein from transposon TNT 1-94 [Tanacetum coccineum]
MRPFGCPVTILNTIDHLGKFDGKDDEGFFVGYSTNSKAFRVFNSRTKIVEENLHVQFSENTSNIAGSTKACDNASKARVETEEKKDAKDLGNESGNPTEGKDSEVPSTEEPRINQENDVSVNNTNNFYTVSQTVNAASIEDNDVDENIVYGCADDPNIPYLEKISRFSYAKNDCAQADMTNLDTHIPVKEPKKVVQALKDPSWIEAMQKELLQFNLQEVWTLVELPNGKRAIGTKWVFRNKKNERVYQMDVKSAFLYGKIEEEVYVCQPPGFEDPNFPDRMISFLALQRRHYALNLTERMMHKKFQMSSMGKFTFFLGLQVKQKEDGIFISQDKYVTEILKKFGFSDVKTASTPIETHKSLLKDVDGKDVDEHLYRSMIGSLMYLLLQGLILCFRFEQIVDFLNANPIKYALTVNPTIYTLCIEQFWDTTKVKTINGEVQLQTLVDGKKVIITGTSVRRDLQLDDTAGNECLPNADIFEQLALMGYEKPSQKLTIYEAFFSPQWKFLIHTILQCLSEGSANPTDPHHTPIITQPLTSQPQKKQKPRKPKSKETEIPQSSGLIDPIADEVANEENVPTHSNDPLLSEKKGGSRTHKLKRLFKVGRSAQVASSKDEGLGDHEDASKQGRKIDDIDKDADVTLVDETQGRYGDDLVFDTSVLDGKEVFTRQDVVKKEVSTADLVTPAGEVVTTASVEVSAARATLVSAATTITTTAITEVDLTLAQALADLRSAKPKVVIQDLVQNTTTIAPSTIPKAKSITFRDPGKSTTRTTLTPIPSNIKDKCKAKMIEPENPLKKKEQIRLDEELAFKLQAKKGRTSKTCKRKG